MSDSNLSRFLIRPPKAIHRLHKITYMENATNRAEIVHNKIVVMDWHSEKFGNLVLLPSAYASFLLFKNAATVSRTYCRAAAFTAW